MQCALVLDREAAHATPHADRCERLACSALGGRPDHEPGLRRGRGDGAGPARTGSHPAGSHFEPECSSRATEWTTACDAPRDSPSLTLRACCCRATSSGRQPSASASASFDVPSGQQPVRMRRASGLRFGSTGSLASAGATAGRWPVRFRASPQCGSAPPRPTHTR